MSQAPRLILASQSPRRAELLRRLGLRFDVRPASLDETYVDHEKPAEHAERLAREKASTVAARHPDAVVIGSDTIVIVDHDVLGKPRDDADAVAMLQRLAGSFHQVFTGVAVVTPRGTWSALERVSVRFRALTEADCREYVATGESRDKAGAYGIQGFGSALVESIDGDYFAVMGLPVVRTLALLRQAGWCYRFDPVLHPCTDDGRKPE
ncbi:MAG: Maf family protein [Gemmatimonadota bacterium]